MNQRVTICVLMYGDYPALARQVIDSVISLCDRRQYLLFVGCNACSPETLEYLRAVEQIDRYFISEQNLNKCPMQRRMYEHVETEFVWWFDDDSYIVKSDALQRRVEIADAAPTETVLWGPCFFWHDQADFNFGVDVKPWVRAQPWYSREPVPCDPSGDWLFAIGANWCARTSILRALDWPPPEVLMPAEDALFCEAIRQSGHRLSCFDDRAVKFQTHDRRLPETQEMMERQIRGKTEPK
jgi:hypothetical protein